MSRRDDVFQSWLLREGLAGAPRAVPNLVGDGRCGSRGHHGVGHPAGWTSRAGLGGPLARGIVRDVEGELAAAFVREGGDIHRDGLSSA